MKTKNDNRKELKYKGGKINGQIAFFNCYKCAEIKCLKNDA